MLFAILRLVIAIAGIAAVVGTTYDTAQRATINPFNFFGYFTIQSNIIAIVVFLASAYLTFRRRKQGRGISFARGAATTYIVIVGIVYNTLLVGLEGGVSLPWANFVLHVLMPLYAAIDWIFFGDRVKLPWNRFWLVLVYPIVWLIVVLIRGATDGWVPYPFLDPAQGYGVVSLYALGIAVAFGVFGSLVWWLSRVRIITP